jgi:hypothetical protein
VGHLNLLSPLRLLPSQLLIQLKRPRSTISWLSQEESQEKTARELSGLLLVTLTGLLSTSCLEFLRDSVETPDSLPKLNRVNLTWQTTMETKGSTLEPEEPTLLPL